MSDEVKKVLEEKKPPIEEKSGVEAAPGAAPLGETLVKEEKLQKAFTFSEVIFSLLFSTLSIVVLYNFFGFNLKNRFSLIIRWGSAVVVWGWMMILTLYYVDWVSRRWQKRTHLVLQAILSLIFGAGLIYFLIRLF